MEHMGFEPTASTMRKLHYKELAEKVRYFKEDEKGVAAIYRLTVIHHMIYALIIKGSVNMSALDTFYTAKVFMNGRSQAGGNDHSQGGTVMHMLDTSEIRDSL